MLRRYPRLHVNVREQRPARPILAPHRPLAIRQPTDQQNHARTINTSKPARHFFSSLLEPNEYYAAQTVWNLLQVQRKELEAERAVLHQTLRSLQQLVSDIVLSFDLDDFQEESAQLIEESRKLHQDQADYRQRLVDISEERRLWVEQHDLVTATLAEMDENFADALKGPSEIACPTCGHHYHNAIADQFEIVQDKDGLCKRAYYQP
jgi:hypothetical protein